MSLKYTEIENARKELILLYLETKFRKENEVKLLKYIIYRQIIYQKRNI